MRHPASSPQEDRDATVQALNDGLDGGRHRPPSAGAQHDARRRRRARPARRSCCCATSPPATRSTSASSAHTIWEPGMRLVRDVVGTPDPRQRDRDGRPDQRRPRGDVPDRGERLPRARRRRGAGREGQGRDHHRPDGPRRHHPGSRAARSGPSTASSATRRSAPTWVARSPSTSAPPTTCCARATSRPSTSPTTPRSSSVRLPAPSPSCPLAVDDEGYLVAQSDFNEPIGASYWEREKQ